MISVNHYNNDVRENVHWSPACAHTEDNIMWREAELSVHRQTALIIMFA
jgi:hypothetical protein